jgi:hypothetical protein
MQYCHNCGKKMPQSSLSFCPFCGTNLKSLLAKPPSKEETPPPKKTMTSSFRPFSNSVDDDDDDRDDYANREKLDISISELDVEIGDIRRNKETIGGLMSQGPTNEEPRQNSIGDPKAVIEAFQKEGSALRPRVNSRQNAQSEE